MKSEAGEKAPGLGRVDTGIKIPKVELIRPRAMNNVNDTRIIEMDINPRDGDLILKKV